MNKTPALLATILLPVLGAALAAQSCAGESLGNPPVNGGGSGGSTSSGSGGSSSARGTGGSTSIGNSSGGASPSSSGGASIPNGGTGGTTVIGGGTGGGGVIIGAGTGGTAVVGTGALVAMNGFVTSGPWHGYASTFASGATTPPTTITPACEPAGTSPCFKTAGTMVCAMGTVAADITNNSAAGLGFTVNQGAASPTKSPVAASGTGLSIAITAYTPGMRAQVQNAAGVIWCANLTAPMAKIPWTMFNTMCYAATPPPAGAFPAGNLITDVGIVVPSLTTVPVPFNFCLVEAQPYN